MLALLVVRFAADRTNIPLAEDWLMVPAFTGDESDFSGWLWSQNNEHRLPFPRLVYLAILRATGGEFVAVGWASLVVQALLAAGLIRLARAVRGRADFADAFFPLQMLHWGHSALFLFPFLISLVLPIAGVLLLGGVLARPGVLTRTWQWYGLAFLLLTLPLSGLVGLLFVPALGAGLLAVAWTANRGAGGVPANRHGATVLIVGVLLTLVVSALYFVGYETPWWNPPSPGWAASFRTALRVLALGFGVAPEAAWRPFVLGAVLLLLGTAWCVVRAVCRAQPGDRLRTWGFAVFVGNAVGFALAIGWSRAGWVPQFGIPSRYAEMVVPAFAACFLAWVLFGPGALRLWVPRLLALAMLVLVPWNTRAGNTYFAEWYRTGMRAFQSDVTAGVPIDELARKHQPFLYHAMKPEDLAERMRALHEAEVAPFDQAVETPPDRGMQQFRY